MADASPWGGWSQANYGAGISPELMALTGQQGGIMDMMRTPGTAYSPDQRYMIAANEGAGGKQYSIYDTTQGAGEPIYQYDAGGKSTGTRAGSGIMSYLQGIALVAGAALGAGAAFGGGAGAGGAGVMESAGAGGLSYTAEGAPIFGAVDTGATAGMSFTGAGAPVFGAVDTTLPYGAGVSYANGAPVFGAVDQGAAGAARQIMQAGGGGGFAGAGGGGGGGGGGAPGAEGMVNPTGATGQQMDQFYQGGSTLGGGATAASPSALAQAMQLLQSGGMSPEFIKQAVFGGGGLGASSMNAGARGALKYAQPLMQIYSGMEGRKQAKGLQGQLAGIADEAKLPDPGDVTKLPGYQAGLEAVRRSMSSQGYQGSGNMMAALSKYGGDFYNQAVAQRLASAQTRGNLVAGQAGPVSGRMSSNALLGNGLIGLAGLFV